MSTSNLLINEPPLQVLPSLAVKLGLNAALILQQLHYWMNNKNTGIEINGYKWIYNSYAEWRDNFPFFSEKTIQRTFTRLENLGIVISEQLNKQNYDHRKYYRIDYDRLSQVSVTDCTDHYGQSVHTDSDNESLSSTETTTETTTEKLLINRPKEEETLLEDDFAKIQHIMEGIIGISPTNASDDTAIKEILAVNPTEEDIENAYKWYKTVNSIPIVHYSSLVNPIRRKVAERTQKANNGYHVVKKEIKTVKVDYGDGVPVDQEVRYG
jgi:hypothetical protein